MAVTRTLVRSGVPRAVTAEESVTLLAVVRKDLGITSAVRGCPNGVCGACRVLVDGKATNACAVTLGEARDGAVVEGYEDVSADPAARAAVDAFVAERPTRCSMCVPAIGVTAVALARAGKARDAGAVEELLEGAACVCTGRGSMRRALLRAVTRT